MKKRLFAAVAAGTSLALAAASPALAVDYTGADLQVGSDNGTWAWDAFGELSLAGFETDTGDSGTAWDGTGFSIFGSDGTEWAGVCASPAQLTEDDGGDTVTCDPELVNNGDGELSVTSEMRFYGQHAIARHRVILTNNTDAAISGQVIEFSFDAYQDSETSLSWALCCGILDDWSGALPTDGTESGFAADHTDLSWATDDRTDNEAAPVVKYAVARADSESLPINDGADYISGGQGGGRGEGEDDSSSYFDVPTLEPGQTVEFLVFMQVFPVDSATADDPLTGWEAGTRDAIIAAHADDALTDDQVLFAGMDSTEQVVNWTPASDGNGFSETDDLAATGFDGAPLGTIALFALAGGVAIVARRRLAKQ